MGSLKRANIAGTGLHHYQTAHSYKHNNRSADYSEERRTHFVHAVDKTKTNENVQKTSLNLLAAEWIWNNGKLARNRRI